MCIIFLFTTALQIVSLFPNPRLSSISSLLRYHLEKYCAIVSYHFAFFSSPTKKSRNKRENIFTVGHHKIILTLFEEENSFSSKTFNGENYHLLFNVTWDNKAEQTGL